MTEHVSIGVRFLGVAASDDATDATIWAYATNPALMGIAAYSAGVEHSVLTEIPEVLGRSIEPLDGVYNVDAINPSFDLGDELVRTRLWKRTTIAKGVITQALDKDTTTVRLSYTPSDGSVIYVGHETIRLGTHTGSGVFTGCTRGLWRSEAVDHAASARVYDGVNRWRYRAMQVVFFDSVSKSWSIIARQFVLTREAEDLLSLQFVCRSTLSALFGVELGREAVNIATQGRIVYEGYNTYSGVVPHVRQVGKPIPSGSEYVAVSIDGIPHAVQYAGSDLDFSTATRIFTDVSFEEPDRGVVRECYEFLCISKEDDLKLPSPVSFTKNCPYPYNPITALWAMVSSRAYTETEQVDPLFLDLLSRDWSVPMDGFLDAAQWAQMIEDTREVVIDQLIVGADGESTTLGPLATKTLMRPHGYYFTITEDGMVGVEQLRVYTIDDACEAQGRELTVLSPNDGGDLSWADGEIQRTDALVLNVGKTPWSDEVSVPLGLVYDGAESRFAQTKNTDELDLSTIRAQRAYGLGGDGGLDRTVWRQVLLAKLAEMDIPTLSITVPPTDDFTYDMGKLYTLGDGLPVNAGLILPDGTMVGPALSDEATIRFMGVLVGDRLLPETGAREVSLWLQAYALGSVTKWRAPSMVVRGSDSGTNTLTTDGFSNFGGDTSDDESFRAGDQIRLYHRYGARWANDVDRTVADSGGGSLELDGWYGVDPASVTPPLVVKVAPSTTYDNSAHVSCEDQPWVFLADADDEIEQPDTSTRPADVYA